jgi:hypothetical protein
MMGRNKEGRKEADTDIYVYVSLVRVLFYKAVAVQMSGWGYLLLLSSV